MAKIPIRTIRRISKNREVLKQLAPHDYVSDVKQILLRFLQKPYVLILYVAVLVLFAAHIDTETVDILDQLASKFPNNPILVWATQNFYRICGALVFAPVIADTSDVYRVYISLSVGIFLLAMPQRSVFEYFVYSIALHVYSKSKHIGTRVSVVLLACAACFSFGIFTNEQLAKLYRELPVVPNHPIMNKVQKAATAVASPASSTLSSVTG
nr:P23 protein [Solanum violifolium ringspot virus]UNH55546.1 P23 protein [Solanum violifolium ringspot virus]UNH55551.1 P23 protein [Solanum violifolium ringspot virus]